MTGQRVRERTLPEGHREPLAAADIFFGGFCVFEVIVALAGWRRGDLTFRTPLAIFAYVFANAAMSEVTRRLHARGYELGEAWRIGVMTLLNPVVYLATEGPMRHFWPVFLINALGQGIVLGLMTERALWGRLLVVYYLSIYFVTNLIGVARPDWYRMSIEAGVIAMVGLMWAQIMSLLGRALSEVQSRSRELQKARDALFTEMEIAHQIQTLLLPQDTDLGGGRMRGHMLTASEVGGDYYDLIRARGRTFIAVGDVSGHGVTAGLTMMMARANLLGVVEASPGATLTEIYRALNRGIRHNLARMRIDAFITFALAEWLEDGRIAAVGRHLPLLVYRAATQSVDELDLDGCWLGVFDDLEEARLPPVSATLARGDALVLYTDGIVEHSSGDDMFGFDRLKRSVSAGGTGGAAGIIAAVQREVVSFGAGREDDMTIVVVERTADAGP